MRSARSRVPAVLVGLAVTVLGGCEMAATDTGPAPSVAPPVRADGYVSVRREPLLVDFAPGEAAGCLAEGVRFGRWDVRYTGFGCVRFEGERAPGVSLAPKPPLAASETHAALLVGPIMTERFLLSADVRTAQQLRVGTPPNPWEAAWLLWSYSDDEHFYYFIPKPNGWELGKRDPAYPGGQRFLATGDAPDHPIGEWRRVEIEARPGGVRIWLDGTHLVDFSDQERPYEGGRIGLYTEDAVVHFRDLTVAR